MQVNNSDHPKAASNKALPTKPLIKASKDTSSSTAAPPAAATVTSIIPTSPSRQHAEPVSSPRSPRGIFSDAACSLIKDTGSSPFEMDRYHWGQCSSSRLASPSFAQQTMPDFHSILCSPSTFSSALPASRLALSLALPPIDSLDARSKSMLERRFSLAAVGQRGYEPETLDFHKELDRFIGELSFDALSIWIPPFTRYTLRELEIASVMENVQVRHDLALRPDLSFKPDESDTKLVRLRQRDLLDYWRKVQDELDWLEGWRLWKASNHLKMPPPLLYPQLWPFQAPLILLPLLVNEVKEVVLDILSLVKGDIKQEVISRFDLASLLKRAQAGHPLTMEPLIRIFRGLLEPMAEPGRKKLFAPLHDAATPPVTLFKAFLDIMEAMKLDLINKELNVHKPYIVDMAARYEWSVFCTQLKAKETSIFYLENWYQNMYKRHATARKMSSEDYKNLYYQGVIDLICMNEYWSHDTFVQLPETFRLDILNLKRAFDCWKELTIAQSSLFIYRQMVGSSHQGGERAGADALASGLKSLYEEVLVLLSDQITSSAHLRAHLSRAISRAKGVASLEAKEEQLIHSLWNEYLTPGHRIYRLITDRLRSIFLSYLQTGKLDAQLLLSSGWQTCSPTLHTCLSALKPMVDLNLITYRHLYNLLFKKFDNIFYAVYSNRPE